MKIKRILFVSILIASISTVQLHAQSNQGIKAGVSTERLERYDNFIKAEVQNGSIPGAVSMVVRNGEIVHKASFGYRNSNSKLPMRTDDIFYIQSMTKPIVTVAFMMLYEEGHFLLTDPVSKYLPAFKELRVSKDVNDGKNGETEALKKEITIANLLSHTAGFSHGLGPSQLDKDVLNGQYMQPHSDILSRVNNLLSMPLVGQPNKQWYYSAAPDVLSVLIEHFSGMSTQTFLRERIFAPLEMKDTGYNLETANHERMVQLKRSNNGDGPLAYKLTGNTIWSGVNGLFSTVPDYMNFCQMLLNKGEWNGKRLLSRKTMELMTSNHTGSLYVMDGVGFGFGFAVTNSVAESKLSGSEGLYYWAGAYNTHFFIDPTENLIGIFMTQTEPFSFYYHNKMRQLVYQAIVD